MLKEPITIDGFQAGIGDPYTGIADMRNIIIDEADKSCRINTKLNSTMDYEGNDTFTADASTDIITLSNGRGYFTGKTVKFTSTGSLPGGLTATPARDEPYYLIPITTNTYKVANTYALAQAGTPIDLTSAGSGVHTCVPFSPVNMTDIIDVHTGATEYIFGKDAQYNNIWQYNGNAWVMPWGITTFNTGASKGLAYWKDHLLVFRNNSINYLKVSTQTFISNWSPTAIGSIVSTDNHYAMVGQDDTVYFANGSYVGSLRVKPGQTFDPTNAATYTLNYNALDIPSDESITYISEFGTNLLIGTNINKVYVWDRRSPSFNYPIFLPERNVQAMAVANNIAYIFCGNTGSFYATNGATTRLVKKIPDSITGVISSGNGAGFGDVAVLKNKIFFGISGLIMSYNIDTGVLIVENEYSNFVTGATTVQSIVPYHDNYFIASIYKASGSLTYILTEQSTGNQNQSVNSELNPYSNYEAYLITPFIKLGNPQEKIEISAFDIQMAKNLISGEAVRISYRENSNDSFTVIGTFDYANYGGVNNTTIKYAIPTNFIQLKIELDGPQYSGVTFASPILRSVTIR